MRKLANAPQKNIPEKPQINNGQWTHWMSEIQVFNMFKLLKVVLLCSSAARASSDQTSTWSAVDELYIIQSVAPRTEALKRPVYTVWR